jgi:hypothetical protein
VYYYSSLISLNTFDSLTLELLYLQYRAFDRNASYFCSGDYFMFVARAEEELRLSVGLSGMSNKNNIKTLVSGKTC